MGKHVKSFVAEVKKNRALFVMAMPAFLLVLIMQYLPMSGLVLAFKNYRYDLGVFGSEWNGFANFEYLFSSGTGWLITRNTVVYNLLNLVTSQLLAVLIAIFISEINKKIFKKVTQSIIFLPYFISWVIVGVFVYNIFNYETGILNSIVTFFGGEKINMLKVAADVHNRSELREIASIYKAKIIDFSPDSMVLELTGRPEKVDAFLKILADYKILEQCRTGVTALERGGMHQHMQKPPQEVRAAQLPLPGTRCPQ